ncbi:SH3 type 3 domain-containing protein [Pseudomonas knackmussii B13]|uniref:SH3 type 3 domain-containing protein n=1 Tax=Pseudomonas knackmussii (strain DSM 6978 / CCUG 54928 / LMG 23759 / B13) TaxID=1301098 RepID=A0A024H9P6_PSEKB|nr:glycine zipper domain-containing protein [Pseudomonas knackmussii]CDF81466.1 SH3 type 3 domain-containing protein [Pseudomonas knackmussii B13]
MGFARKASISVLVATIGFSSGCANMSDNEWVNKENIGTLVGATAGVLIGSQVGQGKGRTAAMLIGALAGGALGKTIGAKMDENDRQALALQTQQVLNASGDGQATTWTSSHSGATAQITPVKTQTESRQVTVKRLPKVQTVSNMTVLNKPFRTLKSANLRNAPSDSAEKVGGLQANATFMAMGRTDNNWIVVGRRGVTVGYIYAPLTAPVSAVAPAVPSAGTTNVASVAPATDLDALDDKKAKADGFDLDAVPVQETMAAQTTCRTVNYDIDAQGSHEQQTVKACQAGDGAWELI